MLKLLDDMPCFIEGGLLPQNLLVRRGRLPVLAHDQGILAHTLVSYAPEHQRPHGELLVGRRREGGDRGRRSSGGLGVAERSVDVRRFLGVARSATSPVLSDVDKDLLAAG